MEYPFDFFIVILSCVDYDASIAWPWTALGGKYAVGILPTRCPSTHACPPCLSGTGIFRFNFAIFDFFCAHSSVAYCLCLV